MSEEIKKKPGRPKKIDLDKVELMGKPVQAEVSQVAPAVMPVENQIDDYYDLGVDYITTPSGFPISNHRVSRSELAQAGVNIDSLVNDGSLIFAGRMQAL